MKTDEIPLESPDGRSLAEWESIVAATGASSPVDVILTEEGPRFYLSEGRTYWLSDGGVVVESVEHGPDLVWRAFDHDGTELDGGVCSARWPIVLKGRQPPWPNSDAHSPTAMAMSRRAS